MKHICKHICKQCQDEFFSKSITAKYCSNKCKYKSLTLYTDIKCKLCSKVFNPKGKGSRLYRSRRCSSNSVKNRKILNCLKEFEVMGYMVNKTRYCSIRCSSDHIIATGRKRLNNCDKALTTKVCNFCKKEYRVHNYRASTSQFCSKECHYNTGRITCNCSICGSSYTEELNMFNLSLNLQHKCVLCREKIVYLHLSSVCVNF